jgi:hypothetical protein
MFKEEFLMDEKLTTKLYCLLSLLCVILAAIAMRTWVNFSSPLPAGTDAAYYPLQARALLEEGSLAYHDLPLIFVVDALLARVFISFGGMQVDDGVLLAARIVDSVLPPLLAVALFALGLAWVRGKSCQHTGSSLAIGLGAAAMLSTASLPILRMTGDFEKNSLGLVWLAGVAWALHSALSKGGRGRWTLVGMTIMLAGMTHVAAFGASVVLAAATMTAYYTIERKPPWRQLAGGLMISCLALVCLLLASPQRGIALLSAPLSLFNLRPGGPPLDPVGLLVCLSVYVILAWGGWMLWRERRSIDSSQYAVVMGAGLCAALLACPLLDGEFFRRLVLMSPVPASIVLVYVMSRCVIKGKRIWPALMMGGLSLLSVAMGLSGGPLSRGIMPNVITEVEAHELRSMRSLVDDSKPTVVLARKGLMWWAGFLMRVPVREDRVQNKSIEKYDRVLLLEEKYTQDHVERDSMGFSGDRIINGKQRDPVWSSETWRHLFESIRDVFTRRTGKILYNGKFYRLYEVRSEQTPPLSQ